MRPGPVVDKKLIAFTVLNTSIISTLSDVNLKGFLDDLKRSYGPTNIENLEVFLPLFSAQLGSAFDGHYTPSQAEEAWSHLTIEQKEELKVRLKGEVSKSRERHPNYFVEGD